MRRLRRGGAAGRCRSPDRRAGAAAREAGFEPAAGRAFEPSGRVFAATVVDFGRDRPAIFFRFGGLAGGREDLERVAAETPRPAAVPRFRLGPLGGALRLAMSHPACLTEVR